MLEVKSMTLQFYGPAHESPANWANPVKVLQWMVVALWEWKRVLLYSNRLVTL